MSTPTPSTHDRRTDLRWAAFGGVASAVIGFGGMAVVGTASTSEARQLLRALLETVRFAASAYVAAGATILALMLTLLTFSLTHDLEFRSVHYRRIRDIAALTTAVIVASVMILMFLSFPLAESDEVARGWYLWVYYGILLAGAATGGVFISLVLMLFYAVRGLIGIGHPDEASDLLIDEAADSAGSNPA